MRAFLRKFSLALTFLTLFALIPFAASAAVAGDLIKLPDDGNSATTSDSAVYYLAEDGKRYAFPNSQTFFTWYENFDTVVTVDAGELASYMLGGNVTYRPGTRLVKIQTDPKVYAVEPSGILRWVQSEAIMISLYGSDWNKRIDDVADTFFVNYTVGAALSSATYPSGSIVKSGETYYRIEGRKKRRLSDDAVRATLRIQDAHVLTESDSLSSYTVGFDITSAESAITDTSQVATEVIPVPPTLYLVPPDSDFIAVGTDATFLELHIASGESVSLTKVTVKVEATTDKPNEDIGVEVDGSDPGDADAGGLVYGNNAQPNLRDIRFEDSNGNAVFGTKDVVLDITKDQSQTFTFTGAYSIPANSDKTLKLVAQMNSLLPTGEGYKVTVVISGVEMSGASTILPTTDLVGTALSTLSEAMQVKGATTTGIENKEYVRGAVDAEVGRLLFEATTAAPNVIWTVSFQGYIDEQEGSTGFLAGADADNGTETRVRTLVPSVSLYVAGEDGGEDVKLAGPVDVTLEGKAVFSSLAYQIPAGETKELILKGDIPATVDLETTPNRVAFDIVDANVDLVVRDVNGNSVLAVGLTPNGGIEPEYYTEIKEKGIIEFEWTGNTTDAIAGREVKLGTLVIEPEDDSYSFDAVSFRHTGSSKQSIGSLTLKYTDRDGTSMEKAGEFLGSVATFRDLNAAAVSDGSLTFELYTDVKQRDGGAVYAEALKVKFGDMETLQFSSNSTQEVFDASVFGGTDFTVPQNLESLLTVRFSDLTFALADGSPSGELYRDASVEVLRFTATVAQEGGVRIKKLKFKVTPGDAGTAGADNDALERWADANGDFADDDAIINLKQVAGENETLIGEGSSARIRYSVVSGGLTDTTPADITSTGGDYGIIEYDLTGSELFLGPGAFITYSVELNLSFFDQSKDHALTVELMGAADLEWTDIPSGTYTERTGAIGVPMSASGTVKK